MEQVTYVGSQKAIEKFLLGIYTLYTITWVLISNMNGWNELFNLLWLVGLCIAWTISLSKLNQYEFRMCVFAFVMQASVVFYGVNADEFATAIPTFMIFTVLLGLSGMSSLVLSTIFSLAVLLVYHAIVRQEWSITYISLLSSQVASVLLLQLTVYTWTKRNDEGNRQLLDTIDQLKTVQSSKDDFVANVSHEIRTPINTICGMSDLILREELPVSVQEHVVNMQMAGRNLMSVVSDILDFSELQSGKIELEEESYNITSTINDIINMTLAKKDEKNLELIVDCDASLPSVLKGDEKKLRRVIMNLVDNAIKFTEEGCVTLYIGYRKESYGVNLMVQVKDTGIGMSERNLEKIFTSFSQIDASRKRQEGGLGLGLAITNALIQKMGGAITMRSKLRKGTSVQVVVPQKVVDETPIAALDDRKKVSVATCFDLEQFNTPVIRDEYMNMLSHMVTQLKAQCHVCRNLAELQRRQPGEKFTHIFVNLSEYVADKEYFDQLCLQTKVIVVLNRFEDKYIDNARILKIYKPFYILSVVSVLNNVYEEVDAGYLPAEKFTTRNVHVLAVDDNRMNLRVIEEILTNYNIRVTTALSGMEALEKIVSAKFDFVFMDHMMPEMDGVETLHRIRQLIGTYYAKVPIIALTANTVAGAREMLLGEGFSDFMEKPIERSVLERVLRRTLPEDKIITRNRKDEEENVLAKETADIGDLAVIDGLNVQQGILYCNGLEPYLSILRAYCEDSDETKALARLSYEKKDWGNYTIAVHGLKSAMFSIGADKISNMAKQLEMAGKEGRIEYIETHHQEFMKGYEQLFDRLKKSKLLHGTDDKDEDTKNDSKMPEISRDQLQQAAENLEEAMYALDGSIMTEILEELEAYQYQGRSMNKILAPMKRKVEMADYVSAYDHFMKWMKDGV